MRVISPKLLQNAAYALMSEAATSLPVETDDGYADESASLPAKHAKTDSRSASLKLLATAAVTPVPAADSDFDQFLMAPAPSGVENNRLSRDDDQLRKKAEFTEFHIPIRYWHGCLSRARCK